MVELSLLRPPALGGLILLAMAIGVVPGCGEDVEPDGPGVPGAAATGGKIDSTETPAAPMRVEPRVLHTSVVSSAAPVPTVLTQDADYLYVGHSTRSREPFRLVRVAKVGRGLTTLARDVSDLGGVAAHAGEVFFTRNQPYDPRSGYNRALSPRVVSREGGESADLLGAPLELADNTRGIAADATHVYVSGAAALYAIDRESRTSTRLASHTGWGGPVAIDGEWVYYLIRGQRAGHLYRVARAGGEPELVVGYINFTAGFALDGDHVYAASGRQVIRVGKAGGESEVLATSPTSVTGVAVTPTYLYWLDSGTWGDTGPRLDGAVMRADRSQPVLVPEVVADQQGWPEHLLVDESSVYWLAGKYGSATVRLSTRQVRSLPH